MKRNREKPENKVEEEKLRNWKHIPLNSTLSGREVALPPKKANSGFRKWQEQWERADQPDLEEK